MAQIRKVQSARVEGYGSRWMGIAMKEQKNSQGNIPSTGTELRCQDQGEGASSQSFL